MAIDRDKERNDYLKSISDGLKKATSAFEKASLDMAKAMHPAYSGLEDVVALEEIGSNIPVELDWETPHIEGKASVYTADDGSVRIELVFSGHHGRHLKDLMRTDPIEKLLVSSMMPDDA